MTSFPDIAKHHCYPTTYDEGATWFAQLVEERGGHLRSSVLPDHVGPSGETLRTLTGWFGDSSAERVLLHICGTHGQEYFCGAAAQFDWILNEAHHLPDEVAVCFVHAHNPYGAAYLSRANENFVDLNRNYFLGDIDVRPNPLYGALWQLLEIKAADQHTLDNAINGFYQFVEDNDEQAAITAMGGGQNTHPSGILYCGQSREWSTIQLQQLVERELTSRRAVVVMDWHTGLGEYAESTILCRMPPTAPMANWAETVWDVNHEASKLEGPEQPDYVGEIHTGIFKQLEAHGVLCADTVVEIGTMDNPSVLQALLIDRYLRFECNEPDSAWAGSLRNKMTERLNPSLVTWREQSLQASRNILNRTVRGLAEWSI